jgi:site-specific DNA-methyltransferase (adenine-specific)
MNKKWDYDVPAVEVWQECWRVLKPGGHLLAFAGTRTQHRMAVRIEDAGFEIRDMIAWVYGSGFPKSLDVSKAIDKAAGAEREVVRIRTDGNKGGGSKTYDDDAYVWDKPFAETAPATEAAKQWQGWGTALKPSLEPITVARKPLCGTVAENVLQHGTGGLNVDGCRVEYSSAADFESAKGGDSASNAGNEFLSSKGPRRQSEKITPTGRWPANLIHDGSDEVVGLFPESDGGAFPKHTRGDSLINFRTAEQRANRTEMGDTGSAARFFYCAKADASERRNSKHPTVKPLALMRYLCRLVCPPDGIVLDPFCGSGTTLEAARLEGFGAIGCELNAEYIQDCKERLKQGVLF